MFTIGELFCGPGGIAAGAKIINKKYKKDMIVHSWATDYHDDTCATFRRNFFPDNPEKVLCKDIREIAFDKEKLFEYVDGISFGFPCNDFSIVGENKGVHGEYGPLYTYCVKAIKKIKPKWFIAENVGGLKSSNGGQAFVKILNELKKSGYRIYPHLYKFEEYGIPQNRHRIIIVGIRSDINLDFKIPKPSLKLKTVREALANIPANLPDQVITKQSKTVIERLKYIKPGENAFNAKLPDHLKLNVKGAKISQIYKRLDPDKPSYTVTGSGGGGTHIYHWDDPRALTNRERARLQTFPDDHVFLGGKESVRRQIGMAVPPEGIAIIFEALIKTFLGKKYNYIEAKY
jgi:DNA (cytosine-5)-methyltransferase 1